MARVAKIRVRCCEILKAHAKKDTATTIAALVNEFGWTESNARNAIRWNAANSGTPLPTDWTVGRRAKVKDEAPAESDPKGTDALPDLQAEDVMSAEDMEALEATVKEEMPLPVPAPAA
jgi:hypothetical protein